MKVGDLVRHRELTYWTGVVVDVKYPHRHIKLHNKDGSDYWEKMNEYEVVSASR